MSSQSLISQIAPEARLILCSARTTLSPDARDQIDELLNRELNWPFLVEFSCRHGLTQLLYQNLNAHFAERVPQDVLRLLRFRFMENVQRGLHLTRELIRLLKVLRENQIAAVPYKGPILGHQAFGSVNLREFCDLDILVQQKDVIRTLGLLFEHGYHFAHAIHEGRAAGLLNKKKDFKLINTDSKTVIELHWRLTGKLFYFSFDLEEIFRRLNPATIAGQEVLTFSPEDNLVILCAHGSKHIWLRLLWICDINELIRSNPDLNWTLVFRRAQLSDSKRMLMLGLYLAHEFFDAPLPKTVLDEIQNDSEIKLLAQDVVRHTFLELGDGVGKTQLAAHELYPPFIRMRQSWWNKFRLRYRYGRAFIHGAITPNQSDRNFANLPSAFSFLYYLLRPVRIIKGDR
jgi:hypothetical protein